MENKVNQVLSVSMEKIKQMVDVNTVVGDPIVFGEVTLISISKVSYGFAGGGTDLPNKRAAELFGGGSGAGVTVTPISMVMLRGNDVRMLPVTSTPDALDRILNTVPDLVNKVTELIKKDKPAE